MLNSRFYCIKDHKGELCTSSICFHLCFSALQFFLILLSFEYFFHYKYVLSSLPVLFRNKHEIQHSATGMLLTKNMIFRMFIKEVNLL